MENAVIHFRHILWGFINGIPDDVREEDIPALIRTKMQEHLPDRSDEEISGYANGITESVEHIDGCQAELQENLNNGKSRETWLAKKISEGMSYYPVAEQGEYLDSLNQAVKQANDELNATIHTQSGNINQNPNLDGMLAEQHHAQTFNLDAAAKGKIDSADVRQANSKNSMDIGIHQTPGGTPDARYQMKYGKTAAETIKYIKEGDYRGQQLLVPADQVEEVQSAFPNRKVSAFIENNGVESQPLSKAEAKAMQEQAQAGEDVRIGYNGDQIKIIAKILCKNVVLGALIGAISSGFSEIYAEKKNGEKLQPKKIAIAAFKGGADATFKCLASGALLVAVESGMIPGIPAGTPVSVITGIVCIGIENAKIAYKVSKGEYTVTEGLGKMQDATLATAGGIIGATAGRAAGSKIGAMIGTAILPGPGTVIGGFIGGVVGSVVGYAAGAKIGKSVSDGMTKLSKAAEQKGKLFGSAVQKVAQTARSMLGFRKRAKA